MTESEVTEYLQGRFADLFQAEPKYSAPPSLPPMVDPDLDGEPSANIKAMLAERRRLESEFLQEMLEDFRTKMRMLRVMGEDLDASLQRSSGHVKDMIQVILDQKRSM